MALGYLGTVLSQTVTYAATEFHRGTGAQGVALAVVRADVVISVGLVALADTRGRRTIALAAAAIACILTALGALSPTLAWLAGGQLVARGFVTAADIAAAVLAAEVMPKGDRAWAVGLMAMSSAVGAGVCVVALPVAGLAVGGWRALYAGALAWLPLLWVVSRHLPESARFIRHRRARRRSLHAIQRSRLALLCAAQICLQSFVIPASEFQNEYLRHERHFSAGRIAVFVIVTVLPGAIGIVGGGRLADTRGRRIVAGVAVSGAVLFGVGLFSLSGWSMWCSAALAALLGAAITPAMTVYGAELFGTERRGLANGLLTAAGRIGSGAGLLAVGWLAASLGHFGAAFAWLSIGPVILLVLIVVAFPETAGKSLEELNPGDTVDA